ncbi:hypothetical protein IAU60_006235 [Kwoniella sp. DSM 27419]
MSAVYQHTASFTADGVLFDMDGTLTDSIAAVEAAWTAKAEELGLDPEHVIRELVEQEVETFEQSILAFADTPPRSRRGSAQSAGSASRSSIAIASTRRSSMAPTTPDGDEHTSLKSLSAVNASRTVTMAIERLADPVSSKETIMRGDSALLDDEEAEDMIDMSVRILPGVRNMINSLPEGKYAVATSGAKTYCHGCLSRTNINIPRVCVTADDPRLLRGKPFPDPFLLAAADLDINPVRAVVFEDSPSGIKAGVAAGATVIAVCTSHKRSQIDNLGAHYVVDTMDQVQVRHLPDGQLKFTITY